MADKMEKTEHFTLATQCMDFCQQLSSQGKTFTFSLSMGPLYHFSLDTKEKSTPNPGVGKVKKSPSTLKRNAKRRKDFLMQKSEPTLVTPDDAAFQATVEKSVATSNTFKVNSDNLEDTSNQKNEFKCESCTYTNQSEKRLQTHIARKHMEYQCELCNYQTSTKASLQKHIGQVHPSSPSEDNFLPPEVERLREDVTVRSLELSKQGDERELPLANSTLETEVAAPVKVVLCPVCHFDSNFCPVSPGCPYEAEYVAKEKKKEKARQKKH